MKKWLVLVAALVVISCASVPLKQKVSSGHQAVHESLVLLDDAERAVCKPFPPPESNKCSSPTAVALGLTDAKHQEFSRALVKAFDADVKASVAIIAWKAGDPIPTDVKMLLEDAQQTLTVAQSISSSSLVDKALAFVARARALTSFFGN